MIHPIMIIMWDGHGERREPVDASVHADCPVRYNNAIWSDRDTTGIALRTEHRWNFHLTYRNMRPEFATPPQAHATSSDVTGPVVMPMPIQPIRPQCAKSVDLRGLAVISIRISSSCRTVAASWVSSGIGAYRAEYSRMSVCLPHKFAYVVWPIWWNRRVACDLNWPQLLDIRCSPLRERELWLVWYEV